MLVNMAHRHVIEAWVGDDCLGDHNVLPEHDVSLGREDRSLHRGMSYQHGRHRRVQFLNLLVNEGLDQFKRPAVQLVGCEVAVFAIAEHERARQPGQRHELHLARPRL